MPKSKRQKVVHLTSVQKKDKEQKALLFSSIRESIDAHTHIYILSVANMRNTFLKDIRAQLASDSSRIFFGKTRVMAKALGETAAEEYSTGLAGLAAHVDGNVGLLITDRAEGEVRTFFDEYSELDFARAGVKATRDVTVPEGVVFSRAGEVPVEEDTAVPHSLEVTLRKWGMPTRLDKGKVMLDQEYVLCREGDTLNSHQTALLKSFGIAMVEFRVSVKAWWEKESGEVNVVEEEGMDVQEG